MRAKQPRIKSNATNPFGHEAGILARGHATTTLSAVFDGLPRLLSQLKLDRSTRLPLADRCAFDCVAVRRNVLDFDGHHVTAAEFAVDRQIEHGEVSGATLDH